MRKLTAICMFLPLVSAMAQSQEMRYLQEQLTVEIERTMIASYYDWDTFLSASMRIGGAGMTVGESKKWDCFKGGLKISEASFYETAGLHEYAKKAHSYKRSKDLLTYTGIAMTVIGVGMFVVDYTMAYSSDFTRGPSALSYVGLGIELIGVTFGLVGMKKSPKLTSVGFAIGVADEHNRQLKKHFQE